MTSAQIVWLGLDILLGILLIVGCKKMKASFRGWLLCAVLGFAGLLAVTFTAGYTGISMSINPCTAVTSVVLGLPGVILMLVLNLLLMV